MDPILNIQISSLRINFAQASVYDGGIELILKTDAGRPGFAFTMTAAAARELQASLALAIHKAEVAKS